ncbi:PTS sugar transporter subunit IIA [Listeria rocourtiae]|uniref:PTS sugar transporter subunit IIA n=1 Tax=Listeria rocourtiae TaxID=647910 RepID=UPI0003E88B0D|nr:PTS sugar transporter subunit IIA [Listeria rocourtiae]EUJ52379.1 PTS system fructose subfamily transporter subunit IIA [Listeria rocourtiae FSL F6-920]
MKEEIALILASHGDFAKEALNSLEMIVGQQENVSTLSLYPGEDLPDFTKRMDDAYKNLDHIKGAIILCDIYGGTPSNAAMGMLIKYQDAKVAAYSGLNLPVLLELSASRKLDYIEIKKNYRRNS